jgi:hypothetical protein
MSSLFDQISLEQEQNNLLEALAEAERSLPQDFRVSSSQNGLKILRHPGLPDGKREVRRRDVEILAHVGLIASPTNNQLYVMPNGHQYYTELKQRSGQPAERLESYSCSQLS